MRGIILTLMAFLALTSVSLAAVTLDYVADDYYVGDGYKSFIVRATGGNLDELEAFTLTGSRAGGDVYQVFNGGAETPWAPQGQTGFAPMDSYIMFGGLHVYNTANGPVTDETIVTQVEPDEGMGTLTNGNTPIADGYLRRAGVEFTPTNPATVETVDLFHLVIPDGAYVSVSATLWTGEYDAEGGGYYSLVTQHIASVQVNCPLGGDATGDGRVDIFDFDAMGTYYNDGLTTHTWSEGDFTGDGAVNIFDFDVLGTSYNTDADWYPLAESAAPIPEPATLVMLVLGSLCLAGYRLRK